MPQQEVFLDETIDGKRIQVIKTYDESYAQEAFRSMSDDAKAFLWKSLKPEELYEAEGLPTEPGEEYDAFLLDELLSEGREEWNTFSYFLVMEAGGEAVFVSPDWPTAEAFAKGEPVPDQPLRLLPSLDLSGTK